MRRFALFVALVVLGTALAWLSNTLGAWWVTPLLGLLIGLILRRRNAFGAAALVGSLGWGLPLLLQALHAPVAQVAATVSILVGLGPSGGPLILLLTILLGLLLCLVGTWLGTALWGIFSPAQPKVTEDVEHIF